MSNMRRMFTEDEIKALAGGGAVNSVNGKTGDVVLVADDIKATNTQSIQANLERIDEDVEANRDDIEDLNDRVDNLASIGRFLAIWDASTGLPTSEPQEIPYEYKTGDYYRVGVVGTYIPNGSEYTGTASTTTTADTLAIGDVYYYDGLVWRRQASSGGGTVQDVQVNGVSVLSGGVANVAPCTGSAYGVIKSNTNFLVVNNLPSTLEDGVVYLVPED